jgi:hypothetical protein
MINCSEAHSKPYLYLCLWILPNHILPSSPTFTGLCSQPDRCWCLWTVWYSRPFTNWLQSPLQPELSLLPNSSCLGQWVCCSLSPESVPTPSHCQVTAHPPFCHPPIQTLLIPWHIAHLPWSLLWWLLLIPYFLFFLFEEPQSSFCLSCTF